MPQLKILFVLAVVLAGTSSLLAAPTTHPYTPTSAYTLHQLRGWTIVVNNQLSESDPRLAAQCLDLLDSKLLDVTRAVPPKALTTLKTVHIWLELDDPRFPCAVYHPSPDWLAENGLNPDKAKCVELSNAANFLTWTKDQPMMVLHELAHAYHDQVLGYDDPAVKAAYDHARTSGIYENVLRASGHHEPAYAMTNDQEYFAESSEAFFGANDFYPFVRAELHEFDPQMYELLKKAWGAE